MKMVRSENNEVMGSSTMQHYIWTPLSWMDIQPHHQSWHHRQRTLTMTKRGVLCCICIIQYYLAIILVTQKHMLNMTQNWSISTLNQILCPSLHLTVSKSDHPSTSTQQWWTYTTKTGRMSKSSSKLLLQNHTFHIPWITYCINNKCRQLGKLSWLDVLNSYSRTSYSVTEHLLDIYFL